MPSAFSTAEGTLDLEDADRQSVELLDVGMGDRALACAAGREGQAAHPVGREAHPAHRVGRLLDRFQARDHQALRPEIECSPDAQAGAFLDAHDGRGRGCLQCVDAGKQISLGQRAVLEIEDRPVEPSSPKDLGRDGGGEAGEGAERHLAGKDPASELSARLERVGRHGRPMVRQADRSSEARAR